MVRQYTKDAVTGHPDLDDLIIDDPGGRYKGFGGLKKLAIKIQSFHFDTVIVLHPTMRLAILTWMAKIPKRVGTGFRFYSFFFTHKVYHHRKKSLKHECDLNLELARAVGAKIEKFDFKFFIPAESCHKIAALVARHKMNDKKIVVLHPGSGGSALDWPLDHFAELGDRLVRQNIPVIVTGSAAEKHIVDRVAVTNKKILRMDGVLSIKDLAALLQTASVVVANSTGPLHMAVAVGTRVVGLYAPVLACRPERWGPYGQLDSVFVPDVETCPRCNPKKCRHNDCMRLIPVNDVFRKVELLL